MSNEKILTVTQAAKRLGLSPVRVRQFCQQGRMGRKYGSLWIIDEEDVDNFAELSRPAGGYRRASKSSCG